MDDFDDRVDDYMERFAAPIASLSGAKRVIAEDLAREYCSICAQSDELKVRIREAGYNIKNVQGNIVRNPDVMTHHQLITEKVSIAPKLLKMFDEEKGEEDELLAFLSK
jgi:hypothetical protein